MEIALAKHVLFGQVDESLISIEPARSPLLFVGLLCHRRKIAQAGAQPHLEVKLQAIMQMLAGTSGYSYKEWKGHFYPEDLPASKMLEYYASKFRTVEVNNTFYRMPNAKTLEQWRDAVSPEFRFVIKASQKITHFKRLKEVDGEIDYLFRALEVLGLTLGPVLFQLPPNMKCDIERFEAFLRILPEEPMLAFEFRHASWFDDAVYELLRSRNAALCIAETDDESLDEIVSTADWGYIRLRKTDYADDEIAAWAKRISEQSWKSAWVFFKHEDEGKGPAFAERFLGKVPGGA